MSDVEFRFDPPQLPANVDALRQEVRDFLAEQRAAGLFEPDPQGSSKHDRAFSMKVAERGWTGMTWPKAYGGHERSALERYIVTEELLAHCAPIRGHWAADRQVGPLLLEFGTPWQKETFLPQFASGKVACAIGLSESDSGSDLAAIRTRGVKVDGGWKVDGRKMWISNAHNAAYMTLFVRTSSDPQNRHAGVSRFLLDMSSQGVQVRPIMHMAGTHDINEVILDDVFVPDNMVLGAVGSAWKQIGTELTYERSAPDRWTRFFSVLKQLIDRVGADPDRGAAEAIGRLVSHLWTLEGMSLSIAGMLERGHNPSIEASIVKDLGTHFDQEIPDLARELMPEEARAGLPLADPFHEHLYYTLLFSPALTVMGGTQEILRNNIARGLGLR